MCVYLSLYRCTCSSLCVYVYVYIYICVCVYKLTRVCLLACIHTDMFRCTIGISQVVYPVFMPFQDSMARG